jgi:hypothetical protein
MTSICQPLLTRKISKYSPAFSAQLFRSQQTFWASAHRERSQGSWNNIINIFPQEEIKRLNIGWARRPSRPTHRSGRCMSRYSWTIRAESEGYTILLKHHIRLIQRCQIKRFRYIFIFHKRFYLNISGLKTIGHRNTDNNLKSPCTFCKIYVRVSPLLWDMKYCHVYTYMVTIDGVNIVEWIHCHLYTRLGTTSDCNSIADLHTLQTTTTHARPQSFRVFPSRCLVTAPNSRDCSASVLTPLPAG